VDFQKAYGTLKNPKNVLFKDLLAIATEAFGSPRVNGTSHHLFKVPWQGKPWVNLQKDGKHAKEYQVKQVMEALQKLEVMRAEEAKKLEGAKNEKLKKNDK
jgi:hypothetical protein